MGEPISSHPSEREMHLGSEEPASSYSSQEKNTKPGSHPALKALLWWSTLLPPYLPPDKLEEKTESKWDKKQPHYFNKLFFPWMTYHIYSELTGATKIYHFQTKLNAGAKCNESTRPSR